MGLGLNIGSSCNALELKDLPKRFLWTCLCGQMDLLGFGCKSCLKSSVFFDASQGDAAINA